MKKKSDNRLELFNQIMVFLIILVMGTMTEMFPNPHIRIMAAYAVIVIYLLITGVNTIVIISLVVKDLF